MPGKIKETFKGLVWPRDRERVKEIQAYLREKRVLKPLESLPRYVAGVDAAFLGDKIISTACLYKFPELTLIEENYVVKEVRFPYIPGMLSFREGPAIIDCVEGLKTRPDLIIFDGQGIAHPLGLGIAACVGMIIDIPSVGCAKSRLVGEYREPKKKKGSWAPLEYKGDTVGAVLRTQTDVKPVFVSPGHRIDLAGSIDMIMQSTGKYRLPEPVRRADMLSKKIKRDLSEGLKP
jgi:deoxyribonuclease V